MRRMVLLGLLSLAALLLSMAGHSQTTSGVMQPLLTRAYDNNRSGQNLHETILNQQGIITNGVKKRFTLYTEGDARGSESQPLIIPNVHMPDGSRRDVLILSTMNNIVWAYDANSSDILWCTKLGIPINGHTPNIDAWNINDHWGILSTGVIDPDTLTWYGVAWTSADGSMARAGFSIYALDIRTGQQVAPAQPLSTWTYQPINGGLQTYGSMPRKQRSSLVLTNVNGLKTIFWGSGTVSETGSGAAGWIFAYDVASHKVTAALALSSGFGAGVWMAGQGMAADSAGFLYAMTGNGSFDPIDGDDFAESFIKVHYSPPSGSTAAQLAVYDWWTPYTDAGRLGEDPTASYPYGTNVHLSNASQPTSAGHMPVNMASDRDMNGQIVAGHLAMTKPKNANAGFGDEDLGSAGVTLLLGPGIVAGGGKDGILYEVKMGDMGETLPEDFANAASNYARLAQPPVWFTFFPGYNVPPAPQDPSTLDFLYDGKTRHMHSTPVQLNTSKWGLVLFGWGENSNLREWAVGPAGKLTYLAQSAEVASANITASPGGMPGGFCSGSSNNGVAGTALLVCTIPYGDANKSVTNGRLLIYDPENFITNADGSKTIKVLWDSQAQAIPFLFNKFLPPVIDGGKIFVTNYSGGVDVYY